MKLSKLVDYLNLLESNQMLLDYHAATKKIQEVEHVITNHVMQIDNFADDFAYKVQTILNAFTDAHQTLEDLKNQLRQQISSLEPEQYQNSQLLHEEEMRYATAENLLNRRLRIDAESEAYLQARMLGYTDWRLPGLIIRPGLEKFIEHLVPLDPLYVADQNLELLEPALSQFTIEYRRRLRPYVIHDEHQNPLWQLPDQQFGFIFAYNYFNFKPMEILRRYLDNMYAKLRPGGAAIFTFNDCDWAHGVALAERSFMCYTPGREIQAYVESLGFEIVVNHRAPGDVSWLEIKKPGEIESIRGGQSLAKIVANQ